MGRQIKALMEAGRVERLHCNPHHLPYSVAQHSWGMAALLHQLHPQPVPQELVWAVLFHDVAERWTGDVPQPIKRLNPRLGQLLEEHEEQLLRGMGLWQKLPPSSGIWLKALDALELYLFCLDEANMGNTNLEHVQVKCWELLQSSWVPPEITQFLVDQEDWERVPDGY